MIINTKKPTAVDLFSGCGGISAGLKNAGFEILAGIDSVPIFLETFKKNFPRAHALHLDLSKEKPEDFMEMVGLKRGKLDLLTGGPPCQGFSKNVPRKNRYLEDPRNTLVRNFIEYCEALRPKFILMENVAEMKNGFSQSYTEELMDRLTEAGYSVIHDVLNAAYFGVPQRRRRAFFLAARDGVIPMFPEKTHFPVKDEQPLFKENTHVTVWEAIGDLPKLQHGEGEEILKYTTTPQNEFQRVIRKGSKNVINHQARKLSPIQHLRLSSLKPGEGIKNLPEAIRPKSGYSGAYGRLTKDMVAPTITRWVFHPGSGRYGHPVQSRVITIREAARIQAFPDTFKFEGTYIQQSHQIGNAVPSLLAQRIGEKFLSLSKTSPKKVIQETRQVVKV